MDKRAFFTNRIAALLIAASLILIAGAALASNQYEKQRMFASWFKNSQLLAEVVYYDKDLENAARNSSASACRCSTK